MMIIVSNISLLTVVTFNERTEVVVRVVETKVFLNDWRILLTFEVLLIRLSVMILILT